MNTVKDYEALCVFYRAEEGGEFFNASLLGKREEGVAPILEGERSTWGRPWFPCGGETRKHSGTTTCGCS
jgi:hypothetical protein